VQPAVKIIDVAPWIRLKRPEEAVDFFGQPEAIPEFRLIEYHPVEQQIVI